MKKKILIGVLCAVVLCAATLLIAVKFIIPVYDVSSSDIYSDADIKSAMEVAEAKINEFDGCRLISLKYAGDDKCIKEAVDIYSETIVINSVFLSPLKSLSAWEPHSVYKWFFILGRNNAGNWEIVNYGYA